MPDNLIALAIAYSLAAKAASLAGVDAEAEAQLTVPVSNLFVGVAEIAGLGQLQLIRETRLDRTKPDFAAMASWLPDEEAGQLCFEFARELERIEALLAA